MELKTKHVEFYNLPKLTYEKIFHMRFISLDTSDKYKCQIACKKLNESVICVFDIQEFKKKMTKTKLA